MLVFVQRRQEGRAMRSLFQPTIHGPPRRERRIVSGMRTVMVTPFALAGQYRGTKSTSPYSGLPRVRRTGADWLVLYMMRIWRMTPLPSTPSGTGTISSLPISDSKAPSLTGSYFGLPFFRSSNSTVGWSRCSVSCSSSSSISGGTSLVGGSFPGSSPPPFLNSTGSGGGTG
ncbi:hypothetical protein TYRP_016516 [Tyrophagus putrescentiae]|nr:hypothetical protein TYRP_016516 [Tyrophagus putrescentiae]